jgi:hypothetical protein
MFNSQRPKMEDLPSNRQLMGATAFALAASAVILTTIVLPSEYAIDPTGVGRSLGLTQMGEIKAQLAKEAAADAAATASATASAALPAAQVAGAQTASDAPTAAARSETMQVTLAPGEGAEIKAAMQKGARIAFNWSVDGGHVNFDTHADAPGIAYHGYEKGQQSTGQQGELVAAFDGKHGWFWRNRSAGTVTVTLRVDGEFSELKRVV